MKPKDLAVISLAVFLGAIISVFASKLIFGGSLNKQQVEVVPLISSNLGVPDKHYFNAKSIDPTQFIRIKNYQNQSPFNASPQQ